MYGNDVILSGMVDPAHHSDQSWEPDPAHQNPEPDPDDRPPFFRTWKRLYIVVLVYVAGLIALFYIFTEVYRFSQ